MPTLRRLWASCPSCTSQTGIERDQAGGQHIQQQEQRKRADGQEDLDPRIVQLPCERHAVDGQPTGNDDVALELHADVDEYTRSPAARGSGATSCSTGCDQGTTMLQNNIRYQRYHSGPFSVYSWRMFVPFVAAIPWHDVVVEVEICPGHRDHQHQLAERIEVLRPEEIFHVLHRGADQEQHDRHRRHAGVQRADDEVGAEHRRLPARAASPWQSPRTRSCAPRT